MSNQRVLIIAEAGVNHNGDLNLAKKLIDAASDAGVDYVKFQTFKTEKLVSKSAQKASYQSENLKDDDNSQFSMLKKLELSPENHFELIEYAKQKGVNFLSTAFDLDSLAFLDSLNLSLFKVPSGEITNKPYLQAIAKTKKPVIISTGMANMQEIEDSISVFETEGYLKTDITVLHCNTQYPTPFEDVNLMAMKTIGDAFGVKIGYSDHTNGIEVPTAAVALGATVIEKHFTLDKTMEGPDHKASLDPKELKGMVSAIRNIEIALGNGEKKPSPSESKNLEAARKSIHLAVSLKKGEVLKYEHLIMKRPGNGISPMDFESALGKKVNVDLEEDTQLKPEHLS
jgi:N,N'-diacetyllegionaminate synthase